MLLGCMAWVRTASAHDPFELTTVATIRPDRLDLVVAMTRSAAAALASPGELEVQRIEAGAPLFEVTSNGRELRPRETRASTTEEDEVEVVVTYPAPAPGPVRLTAIHLKRLPAGYGNAVSLRLQEPPLLIDLKYLHAADVVLDAEVPEIQPASRAGAPPRSPVSADSAPAFRGPSSPPAGRETGSIFLIFLELGVKHIFEGYDHILLLAGLLIACRNLRAMLGLITCFTIAHSATLILATLDFISLPEPLVESTIAASIVVVGVQNIFGRDAVLHRYPLTFAFGLIHGLGFAGVLKDLALGNSMDRVVPLLSFNLGVELGQITIAVVVLPVFLLLRRLSCGSTIIRGASLLIIAIGIYWFFQRAL